MKRYLSFLLAFCMFLALLPVQASASEVGHVIRNPELLETVVFPDHWSRDALIFCVGNGILKGRDDGLAHEANTSRAETAAMLVRLLGGEKIIADLSGFTDVDPKAWYYGEVSSAVALGILNGTSETTLAPNDPVTREQVFAMFCRAFGLYPEDAQRWSGYTDGEKISPYARCAISALAERGCIKGYPDGTILPDQPITRGELAQLIYGLFTHICDSPDQLPEQGWVLYRGEEPIPEDYRLDGRLFLGCGLSGEVTFHNVQISDTCFLHPAPDSKVLMTGCNVAALAVAGDLEVTSDAAVKKLFINGSGSRISLDAVQVWVGAGCTLSGSYDYVCCTGDAFLIKMDGYAKQLDVRGDGVSVDGKGFVEQADLYGMYSSLSVSCGQKNNLSYSYFYDNALSIVETVEVWDTVTRDTYLYSSSGLYGAIRFLPAGTKLLHYYLHDGASAASVYTDDGQFGYVSVNCIQIPKELELSKTDYSQATLEGFVDKMGYSSSSKYLIWVSLKTQTVNIFTGKKGSWSLVKSAPCASGKPATPTVKGTFRVQYRYNTWVFDGYKVRYVTGFYEGYAFHSRSYNNSFTVLLDPTIGEPASHGCLRMLDEDCKYIYDNIPYGTTVVVY